MSPTRKKPLGPVVVVGVGPGDPGLLPVRGAQRLATTDAVVSDGPTSPELLGECSGDVEVVDVAERTPAEAAKAIVALAREGKSVVRLVADPASSAATVVELEALAKAKVPWELVPGVAPTLGIAAYAGVPLGRGASAAIASVPDDGDKVAWRRLAEGPRTLAVSTTTAAVGKISTQLVEYGRPGDTPVSVTVSGTTVEQHTVVTTLDAVSADVPDLDDTPAVIVIGDAVAGRPRLSWFETKPLFGWNVLVPRTKEQAVGLSEQLRGYGATPTQVPTIAVEPPRTPAQMDRAIRGLVSGRYQWIAFTSANAVRAVREKLEEVGLDARAFAGVRVAAVGEATASSLQGWGIKPDLVPSGQQSGEGLLADWMPYDEVLDPINRVFLPRADIATETLAAGLKELGWEVDDVTAYRTVRAAPPPAPIREAIKTGGFDAVLFTSSSTVRNLVGIAGKPHPNTVIAVIGPKTAATVEEFGLRVDVAAESPSVSVLAQALADFATRRREELGSLPPSKLRRSARKKTS